MEQLSRAAAKELFVSGFWEGMSAREIALFQLSQERLCIPFGVFHEATEEALGRSVWSHEFAKGDLLMAELLGDRTAPTFQEIVDMVPRGKRILVEA
jgi:hypothetical protein